MSRKTRKSDVIIWAIVIISCIVFMLVLSRMSKGQTPAVRLPFGRFWVLSQRIDALEDRATALESENAYLKAEAAKAIPYILILGKATAFNSAAEMMRHEDTVAQNFIVGQYYVRGDGVRVEWTTALETDLGEATAKAVEHYNAAKVIPDLQLPPP